MADVLISFIHEEEKVATSLQQLLRAQFDKSKIFLSADEWQIHAGEQWLEKIRAELEAAKIVALMLSPRSVSRPWVNFEAGGAWLTGKVIVPVCFCGLKKGSLPKPYSNFQAVEIPEDTYYLIRSISHHLGEAIPPPPLMYDMKEFEQLKQSIK